MGTFWITVGVHFFHPILNTMITIATMEFDSKLKMKLEIMSLFWTQIDLSVARFKISSHREQFELKFDPAIFVSDAQGSGWTSVRKHYGGCPKTTLEEGTEQSCKFHFLQGVNRLEAIIRNGSSEILASKFGELAIALIEEEDLQKTVDHFQKYKDKSLSLLFLTC